MDRERVGVQVTAASALRRSWNNQELGRIKDEALGRPSFYENERWLSLSKTDYGLRPKGILLEKKQKVVLSSFL